MYLIRSDREIPFFIRKSKNAGISDGNTEIKMKKETKVGARKNKSEEESCSSLKNIINKFRRENTIEYKINLIIFIYVN